MDAAALAGELVGDGVDQERHVVGDDLDHGVAARPAVLLDGRGVHPDVRLALGALLGQPVVRGGGAEHVDRVPALDVLGGGVQVVALEVGEQDVLARALLPCPRRAVGPGGRDVHPGAPPGPPTPPPGLLSATLAARASSSALASSSLVCMSSGSCRAPLRDVGEKVGVTPRRGVSGLGRRYAVMRDRRDRIGQLQRPVRAGGISRGGPGTMALRARAGGFDAPEAYRADHGVQAISPAPVTVTIRMCTKEGRGI